MPRKNGVTAKPSERLPAILPRPASRSAPAGSVGHNRAGIFIATFHAHLLARGASHYTIKAYQSDLVQFVRSLSKEKKKTFPEGIERKDIASFLLGLRQTGYKDLSIARKQASLRTFFRWAARQNHCQPIRNMPRNILPPIEHKPNSEYLRYSELEVLLLSISPRNDVWAARDFALMSTIVIGCLKVNEIRMLDLGALNFTNSHVTIAGKYHRNVPLAVETISSIQEYSRLLIKSAYRFDETPLFVSKYGERLSTRGIARICEKWSRRALGFIATPQALRNTGLLRLMVSGMDTIRISNFIGQKSAHFASLFDVVDEYKSGSPRKEI